MPKIIYSDSQGVERTIELGADPVLIGRATECQIQTQDGLVSRRHARIVVYNGLYWIEDTGSANGVYVNGEKVTQAQLRPEDQIACGSLSLRFAADVKRNTAYTEAPPAAPAYAAPAPAPAYDPAAYAAAAYAQGYAAPAAAPAYVPAAPAQPAAPAPDPALQAELETERRRRMDAEFERDEALRKIEELTQKLASVQQAAPAARAAPAVIDPQLQQEAERARRRLDQIESNLRRRGGPPGGPGAQRVLEEERDRLRARIAEIEGAPMAAPSGTSQGPDPRLAELEEKLRLVEEERDRAVARLTEPAPSFTAAPDPQLQQELERVRQELQQARRRIDQLESDQRRRGPTTAAAPAVGGMAEPSMAMERDTALRQLRELEKERDSLKALVAGGANRPKLSPRVGECLAEVSDGLASLRGALRAAGDDAALEDLEKLRGLLREVSSLLGLPT